MKSYQVMAVVVVGKGTIHTLDVLILNSLQNSTDVNGVDNELNINAWPLWVCVPLRVVSVHISVAIYLFVVCHSCSNCVQ